MGARGPQQKLTALRMLEGNPGRLPINLGEPRLEPGATPPDWLSNLARVEWERLAPLLRDCGVLTAADRDVLAAYCTALADYAGVTREIEQLDSPVIEDRYGRRIAPEVTAQRHYAELMLKLGG